MNSEFENQVADLVSQPNDLLPALNETPAQNQKTDEPIVSHLDEESRLSMIELLRILDAIDKRAKGIRT